MSVTFDVPRRDVEVTVAAVLVLEELAEVGDRARVPTGDVAVSRSGGSRVRHQASTAVWSSALSAGLKLEQSAPTTRLAGAGASTRRAAHGAVRSVTRDGSRGAGDSRLRITGQTRRATSPTPQGSQLSPCRLCPPLPKYRHSTTLRSPRRTPAWRTARCASFHC